MLEVDCVYCEVGNEYVEIKCQLDATEVFIVDLIACSTFFGHHYAHHQELKSIIQGVPGGMDKTSGECSLC